MFVPIFLLMELIYKILVLAWVDPKTDFCG